MSILQIFQIVDTATALKTSSNATMVIVLRSDGSATVITIVRMDPMNVIAR